MATIVTRAGKGSALSHTEMDANFTNLNTDKAELSGATFTGTVNLTSIFQIGGIAVTSTAAELNALDGITSTVSELNILDGVTSTTAELNILDGVTSTTAELNVLDGITPTTTELNYVDGVTSAIQTQLNTKLVKTNNLSDLSSASTARNNLGLGALAILDSVNSSTIDADSIGNSELKTAVGSSNTQTILSNATWTPSAGYYNVMKSAGVGSIILQIQVSSTWYDSGSGVNGFFWFDGTNMRIKENSGNNVNIAWQKLG